MTKKILITGANGQLGHEMRNALKGNNRFECIFTDVAELDICNAEAVKQTIADNHIDYIVNCAAYTQVDKAEDNAELCKKINTDAVENLARAAATYGARMIHISTDYVFNGRGYRPYTEDVVPDPQSVYGSTKLEGEKNIDRHLSRKHYHSHSMVILSLRQQFCQNHAAFRRRTGGVIGSRRPDRHAHLCHRPRTSNPCHTASGYIRAGNIPFLRRRGMQLV